MPADAVDNSSWVWLALTVSALGGGIVATLLGEWLRSLRAYDEARLMIVGELSTNRELALAVKGGTLEEDVFRTVGIETAAWIAHRSQLVRMLHRNHVLWGLLDGAYSALKIARETRNAMDVDALVRTLNVAIDALYALRPLRLPHWRRLRALAD